MYRLVSLLIGYAFGCIQSGYFLSRRVAGIDIREHGSGSAGMTNTMRVLGFKWGAMVFVADVAKTIAAFVVASLIFGWEAGIYAGLYAGLGAVLGHDFPFYLRFKGGKGVASTIGLAFMLDWRVGLIVCGTAVLLIFITRYVSIASMALSLAIPASLALLGHSIETVMITMLLCAISWRLHKGNVQRLLDGKENKFGKKIKKDATAPEEILPPYDPSEPLPFPPNEGKQHEIDVNGTTFVRIPIRTHVITNTDTLESAFASYVKPHVRAGDVVFFSEKAVACTQNRAIPMKDIKPRKLAVFLSNRVTKSPWGIGLGIPETMEMALQECGTPRILFAAAVSAIGKLFGQSGWFYHVAGSKARGIDGPCDYTLPPYNEYVVLTPLSPDKSAMAIRDIINTHAIIVDSNDKGCHVLGVSDVKLDRNLYAQTLGDNPLGQAAEQTPCGIIRKV